jgi:hypothetical protein
MLAIKTSFSSILKAFVCPNGISDFSARAHKFTEGNAEKDSKTHSKFLQGHRNLA